MQVRLLLRLQQFENDGVMDMLRKGVVSVLAFVVCLLVVNAKQTLAQCSTTTYNSTVIDTNSITWTNASVTATLVNYSQGQNPVCSRTGQSVQTTVSGTNTAGIVTFNVISNDAIFPSGTRWQLQICPNLKQSEVSTVPCYTTGPIVLNGTATVSIPQPAPLSVYSGANAQAYADSQITSPVSGSHYYNVTTNTIRMYSNGAWGDLAGGSVINSSVNGTINPKAAPYNASGTWVSGTTPDDTNALYAACDAARATNPPKTVVLPYGNYLTGDLSYHCAGVSFSGAVSGMGLEIGNYTATLVGKPGQDVFHSLDPNLPLGSCGQPGVACPVPTRSWGYENLTVRVDDSVDPNNRAAYDGVTNGTTTVTSNTMNFTAGDVGAYMTMIFQQSTYAGYKQVVKITGFNANNSVVVSAIPGPSTVPLSQTGVHLYLPLASPAFPNRFPGRWTNDASMTSGSSVVTSSKMLFTCGDVSQWIVVKGAGVAGADLVAQIPAQNFCTQVTTNGPSVPSSTVDLGAANQAGTTVSNANVYVAVNGLGPYERISNCAFVWDNFDGNTANWIGGTLRTNSYPVMRNVAVNSISGGAKNHSCGIYFQGGNWHPYGIDAQQLNIGRVTYCIVQGTHTVNGGAEGQDYQTWKHMKLSCDSPFIQYNGGYNRVQETQLASTNGYDFISINATNETGVIFLNLNIPEFEQNINNDNGGYTHLAIGQSFIEHTVLGRSAHVNGTGIRCISCQMNGTQVAGVNNVLEVSGWDNELNLINAIDKTTYQSLGAVRIIGERAQSVGVGSRPAVLSGTRTMYSSERRADFGTFTPSNPFLNLDDLYIFPYDIACHGVVNNVVQDAASESGYVMQMGAALGCQEDLWLSMRYGPSKGSAYIGGVNSVIPAQKNQAFLRVKCPVITSFQYNLIIKRISDNTTVTTLTFPGQVCGTSYATNKITYDLSPYGGGVNYMQPSFPSQTGEVDLAWELHRPLPEDLNGSAIVSLTTAAATTDNVAVSGMTSTGHCTLSPTNASAATNIATTYISAKTTNQITVTHTATAGMTYDIHCTSN